MRIDRVITCGGKSPSQNCLMQIVKIDISWNLLDIMTKPLPKKKH